MWEDSYDCINKLEINGSCIHRTQHQKQVVEKNHMEVGNIKTFMQKYSIFAFVQWWQCLPSKTHIRFSAFD